MMKLGAGKNFSRSAPVFWKHRVCDESVRYRSAQMSIRNENEEPYEAFRSRQRGELTALIQGM